MTVAPGPGLGGARTQLLMPDQHTAESRRPLRAGKLRLQVQAMTEHP